MKTPLLILAALACASNSHAQYVGPTVAPSTVRALLADGKDDMAVNLQGKIVRHIGGEKYRFADSTGEITLEIDAQYWPANTPVDGTTEVRIHGEYDKELLGEPEIDVKRIEKLQ
jgi:uncharacterized protein (TIGR00156 family)